MLLNTAVLLSILAAAGVLAEPTTLAKVRRAPDQSPPHSKPVDPVATATNSQELEAAFASDVSKVHAIVFNTTAAARKAHGTGVPRYVKAFESEIKEIESRLSDVATKSATKEDEVGPLTGAPAHTTAEPQGGTKTKRADAVYSSIVTKHDPEYFSILSKYKIHPTGLRRLNAASGGLPHRAKGTATIPAWWSAFTSDLGKLEAEYSADYAAVATATQSH